MTNTPGFDPQKGITIHPIQSNQKTETAQRLINWIIWGDSPLNPDKEIKRNISNPF